MRSMRDLIGSCWFRGSGCLGRLLVGGRFSMLSGMVGGWAADERV